MGDKKKKRKAADGAPKIPKRVAGVKLPKELRRTGNLLLETAASPVGREVLVSGLMAVIAGAATRRSAAASQPQPQPQPQPRPAATDAPETGTIDPHEAGARAARQMIDLIGGAATAALTRYRAERGEEKPHD